MTNGSNFERGKIMKKLVAMLIAIALMLGLVGCGGAQSVDTASSSKSAVEEVEPMVVEDLDSEFKNAMDIYEEFIDYYCDFLEKYLKADTNEQLGMMEEYATVMSQYAEVMEAIQIMDVHRDEMTSAELQYYIEVTARTSQRMIKFSENAN